MMRGNKAAIIGLFLMVLLPAAPGHGEVGAARRSPVVAAVERVGPAVVNISTSITERVGPVFPFSRDDFFRDFFPDLFSREYTRTSLGSGVVIDGERGFIVTNHHVVSRASEIRVVSAEQKEFQARILGSDPRSDLAVLQIEAAEKLPEVIMGRSEDLMIGETVIAIGNPFGLSHTVTTGVVSALDRAVRAEDRVYRNFIQTDASINPGNSGGPLLNIEGELIGINTAIYRKAQGIGFAIPIDKVKRIVRELIRSGEVLVPWLGLEIQELTPDLRRHFNLPREEEGVLVRDVIPESPAEQANIQRGDILTALGGIPLSSPSDYSQALAEFTSAGAFDLDIFRDQKELKITLNASPFPKALALDLVERRLGIVVSGLNEATREYYGLEKGVVISEVRRNSEAGKIGLEQGDLIVQVNNRQIADLESFKEIIGRVHHQPSLTLVVRRGPYAYSVTLPFL